MPGWHERSRPHVEAGRLAVAGIVEEQHPDRARLFMQWQEMDWPVSADPLNLLGVTAIPHTYLVDEHGIIRFHNPKPGDLATFLDTTYPAPESGSVGTPLVAARRPLRNGLTHWTVKCGVAACWLARSPPDRHGRR